MKKDLLKLLDLSSQDILTILDTADQLKAMKKAGIQHPFLAGKTLAMIFEKSSTRTRASFETGMYQLGGNAIYLSDKDSQIGRNEPVEDTARVLLRYCDGIMIRTFAQEEVETLAKYASIPVINGLTDFCHPCQVLADLMTVREHKAVLEGLKMCYIGDGNNMANSLIVGGLKVGMEVAVACPEGYEPHPDVLAFAREAGHGFSLVRDPLEAAAGDDVCAVMMELVHGLVKMRVRPYYIYACDPSLGLSHFRTPVSKGIEIMEALRGHTSGYCVPTFVVDAPGGGGKTPVMPNYLISETPRKVILRNFEGVITSYTQPEYYVQDCHCDVCTGKRKVEKTGVAWVAEGTKQRYLEPTKLLRNERHVKK